MDIVEAPSEYAFVLDVPGLSKYDMQVPVPRGPKSTRGITFVRAVNIKVTLEEDYVLVMKSAINDGSGSANGKRKREEEEGDCLYVWLERRASPWLSVRKFRLPKAADAGAMVARCENGVVAVTIKKQLTSEKKTKSVHVTIA
ncbi:hypothetical protein ZWY2020_022957 [Hordeum vulgare]|nr:hypothetical protein ZWY2020_022957 [Hordeum vulgare]